MEHKTFILAHRGASAMYPENTRLAFDKAYEMGYPGVETDVHLTKDNKLVIIHDETTDRTADLAMKVQDSTLEELKKANLVAKFRRGTINGEEVDLPPVEGTQTIMTLEEFFAEYATKFQVINLEVKTDQIQYPNIEEMILKVADQYKDITNIVYTSFNYKTCQILRDLDKDITIGWLVYEKESYTGLSEEKMAEMREVCQYISIWDKLLFEDRDLLNKVGLPYMTWEWRLDDEEFNYTDHDKEVYEKLRHDPQVFGQIVNYKWD